MKKRRNEEKRTKIQASAPPPLCPRPLLTERLPRSWEQIPPSSNEGKSRPAAGASPAMPPAPPGQSRAAGGAVGRTDGLPHPRRSRPGGGGGPRGSEFPRGAESAARGGGAGGSAGLGAPLHLLPAGTSPSRAGPSRAGADPRPPRCIQPGGSQIRPRGMRTPGLCGLRRGRAGLLVERHNNKCVAEPARKEWG